MTVARRIAIGAKTDVGLTRAHNEDSYRAAPELGLFVVCDGMGGHRAGEVASQLAVEVIHGHLREAQAGANLPMVGTYDQRFSAQANRLASAIRLANQVIHGAARTKPDQAGMGTTVVAGLVTDQTLSVAHVGDSRLYLIRGDDIRQVTSDHSLVAEQVRRGLLTEEEAERSSHRNVVTRALGVEASVEVDLEEVPLAIGDVVLLCSDGLTQGVKTSQIKEVVQQELDPQAASERLVQMANEAGGTDNTTVILVALRAGPGRGV
jgi:protein phosphatase